MEIVLYRHAEPTVSSHEIIYGIDFPFWVQRYNESGVCINEIPNEKELIHRNWVISQSKNEGEFLGKITFKTEQFAKSDRDDRSALIQRPSPAA
jgi:hypothetical protein